MAIPKLKITENKDANVGLAEIGHGNRQVEMAFVDEETGHNISPIVKCKDFFQDIFWSRAKKSSSGIYGFNWSHDKHDNAFSKNWLIIFARIRTVKENSLEGLDTDKCKNLQKFLNSFCKVLKIPVCKAALDEDKNYVTVKFHKQWTEIPYMLSAFLLYVRLGLSYDGEEDIIEYVTKGSKKFISTNDPLYVKSATQKIKDMLEGKIDKRQKYENYLDISNVHNSSGIVNYSGYKID